jgi:hypothetical protein
MLMFAGKVHDLRHFGFRHLVGEDPAFADPVLVYMHHDPMCRFVVLIEKALEDVDHELHRRVVIVKEQNTVKVRPFGLRTRLGNDSGPWSALVTFAFAVIVRQSDGDVGGGIVIRRHCFVYRPDLLLRATDRPRGAETAFAPGYPRHTIIGLERLRFQIDSKPPDDFSRDRRRRGFCPDW